MTMMNAATGFWEQTYIEKIVKPLNRVEPFNLVKLIRVIECLSLNF